MKKATDFLDFLLFSSSLSWLTGDDPGLLSAAPRESAERGEASGGEPEEDEEEEEELSLMSCHGRSP